MKYRTIVWHVLAWVAVFLILFLFPPGFQGEGVRRMLTLSSIPFNLLQVVLFYLNAYCFIPFIFKKHGPVKYISALTVTVIFIIVVNSFLRKFYNGPFPGPVFGAIFPLLFTFAVSSSFRLLVDQMNEFQQKKDKENENLKSELAFLRWQISPHFIFNVLNTTVLLARKRSDMMEPVIIKLSELLRYMLYDNDVQRVPIEREISYLNNYIELQKLRFGDIVTITFLAENRSKGSFIEPMLLIPFVENAFKHGVGLIYEPVIAIRLIADEKSVEFSVKNKYNDEGQKDDCSGIGLNNIERRLNILYNGNSTLEINKGEEWFVVNLKLKLK